MKRGHLEAIHTASPAIMAGALDRSYVGSPHLAEMSKRIVKCVETHGGRLMISAPPRTGKSMLVSIWTPLWFLNNHPGKKVLFCAWGSELAEGFGFDVRDLMEKYFKLGRLTVRMHEDKKARGNWRTTAGGGMTCKGVDGGLSGIGGDLVICDDLLKNEAEANSALQREKSYRYLMTTVQSRLEPGASMILVAHRWHSDDAVGRILEHSADSWDYLKLPALAEPDDPIGREEGEALWPARYDRSAYVRMRNNYTSAAWSALFQQQPQAPGGDVFKAENMRRFSYADDRFVLLDEDGEQLNDDHGAPCVYSPRVCQIAQFIDSAVSEKRTADFTVCMTAARTPANHLLILDVKRKRLASAVQMGHFKAWRAEAESRWGVRIWQYLEDTTASKHLLQLAAKDNYPMRGVRPDSDKLTRSNEAAIAVEHQMVFLWRDAPWEFDLVQEMTEFPKGKYDDQVDCLAYAARELRRGEGYPGMPTHKPRPDAGTYRRDRQGYGEAVPCAEGYEGIRDGTRRRDYGGLSVAGRMRQLELDR